MKPDLPPPLRPQPPPSREQIFRRTNLPNHQHVVNQSYDGIFSNLGYKTLKFCLYKQRRLKETSNRNKAKYSHDIIYHFMKKCAQWKQCRLVTLTYSAEINFVISFIALRLPVDSFPVYKKAEYTGAEKRVGKTLLDDCFFTRKSVS